MSDDRTKDSGYDKAEGKGWDVKISRCSESKLCFRQH